MPLDFLCSFCRNLHKEGACADGTSPERVCIRMGLLRVAYARNFIPCELKVGSDRGKESRVVSFSLDVAHHQRPDVLVVFAAERRVTLRRFLSLARRALKRHCLCARVRERTRIGAPPLALRLQLRRQGRRRRLKLSDARRGLVAEGGQLALQMQLPPSRFLFRLDELRDKLHLLDDLCLGRLRAFLETRGVSARLSHVLCGAAPRAL
mmetsp:Transcript_23720/g.51862  ORF Transcript_23720/g.51862 Transcript_23720/m.51862 type:complete len:208 (-) Transcript_23720:254-877(-)